MVKIYHACSPHAWAEAQKSGVCGNVDLVLDRAGLAPFIHFSTRQRIEESIQLHCADLTKILLIEVEGEALGDDLKWELGRDGELFPHLYAPLSISKVVRSWHISRDKLGRMQMPDLEGPESEGPKSEEEA